MKNEYKCTVNDKEITLKFKPELLKVNDLLSIDSLEKSLFSVSETSGQDIAMQGQFMTRYHNIALAWVACKKADPTLTIELKDLPFDCVYWLNDCGFSFRMRF